CLAGFFRAVFAAADLAHELGVGQKHLYAPCGVVSGRKAINRQKGISVNENLWQGGEEAGTQIVFDKKAKGRINGVTSNNLYGDKHARRCDQILSGTGGHRQRIAR
ncbi:MAG: hypothetical protein PHG32_03850, partial [Candidatus Cloacimonetes bacterium]|nr:hypothetical protein [Candidatus Cloacimonadota bacterium]